MEKVYIADCYILGTALLYLKELRLERLELIKSNLIMSGIDVSLTPESIEAAIVEWRDFFAITDEGSIILNSKVAQNKLLIELIFCSVLSDRLKSTLLSSIFNCHKKRILLFPQSKLE